MDITKREILASISIIAVMLLIGIYISGKIAEFQMDQNEIYNKAVKVESVDMFLYGMDTNIGSAFVYGNLEAVDTVTFPEIGGEYMYVKRIKEKYTQHTRQVSRTRTVNGKAQIYQTTETYWTWDEVERESVRCKEVQFLGIPFSSNKIDIPAADYIDTIKESSEIRYKYYGTGTRYIGTIFTELRDGTIADGTRFYANMSIEKTVEYLEAGAGVIIFWIVWTLLMGSCVYGFYCLENRWLE